MNTLREKIHAVICEYGNGCSVGEPKASDCVECTAGATRAIMHIIENHIEWTEWFTCRFGHTFSDCGWYEIDITNAVYYNGDMIAARHTLEEAKQAAQKHKEGRG